MAHGPTHRRAALSQTALAPPAAAVPRVVVLLPLGLLLTMVLGTLLLKLPAAVDRATSLSWLDALFTSSSAVCLTGLTVTEVGRRFTPLGQTIIALLMQAGGMAMMIAGSFLAVQMKAISSAHRPGGEQAPGPAALGFAAVVRFALAAMLLLELLGAVALFCWWPVGGPAGGAGNLSGRLGQSLFHSVSAFCNVGLTLSGDSLISSRYGLVAHGVVLPLVVLGGLGVPVLLNLGQMAKQRLAGALGRPGNQAAEPVRLSPHSKLVLAATAALYLAGALALAVGQFKPYLNVALKQGLAAHRQTLTPLNPGTVGGALADCSFVSAAVRSSAFHTLPLEQISPAGQFAILPLMLVGGSPGSMAGGFHTVTLALLAMTAVATLRRRQAQFLGRDIAAELVRRAALLAFSLLALVSLSTFGLCLSEPYPLSKLLFESVSAASNSGLSLGVTPDLTSFGKVVIVVTMFLGRIGPLVMLLAWLTGPRAEAGDLSAEIAVG